jgi:hypothetical protein
VYCHHPTLARLYDTHICIHTPRTSQHTFSR